MEPADAPGLDLSDPPGPQEGPDLPPQRSRRGLGLIFQSHEGEEIPPPAPGEGTSPLPDDGSPSGSEWPPAGNESSDDLPTSSPSPSDPGPPLLSKRQLKETFRQGVLISGGVAHRLGARTEGQQAAGLFLADEEDAANIGDPLASIAARHDGITGKVSPDTADLISSVMGIAGYMSKQMVRTQQARQLDAGRLPTVDPAGQE